jgi:hypothetical protein
MSVGPYTIKNVPLNGAILTKFAIYKVILQLYITLCDIYPLKMATKGFQNM